MDSQRRQPPRQPPKLPASPRLHAPWRSLRAMIAAAAPGLAASRRLAHERRFFAGLLPAGGLAFDVGACQGRFAHRLLERGRVIAVEPDPDLAAGLRARFAAMPALHVEEVALGAAPGRAVLRRSDAPTNGTLSPRFEAAFGAAGAASVRYVGEVEVSVATLDALLDRHGMPDYIKLDVEGLEAEVLAGLHQAPAAVSLEVNAPLLDVAQAALHRLAALGAYRCAFSPLEELRPSPPWLTPDALAAALPELCRADGVATGDVFARRIDA